MKTRTSLFLQPVNASPSLQFKDAITNTVGKKPLGLASGDFNSDGRLDLVTANSASDSNTISLLFGNGDGTFNTEEQTAVGASPFSVIAADFNGDGKLDLATANSRSNSVSVLLGTGRGNFYPAVSLPVGLNPVDLVSGDINNDGKVDLIVANHGSSAYGSDGVSILLGTGTGRFTRTPNLSMGQRPVAVTVADLNGDRRLDLITANRYSNSLSVRLARAGGGFDPTLNFATGKEPSDLVVGDFNQDGRADIATANHGDGSNSVSVLLGRGNGSFAAATSYKAGTKPYAIATGDINRDGKLDLVTGNYVSDDVSVLFGNGNGTFDRAVSAAAGRGAAKVLLADFDSDAKLDIATANFLDDTTAVLLSQTVSQTGTILLKPPSTIDASAEKSASIRADLSAGKLTVSNSPGTTNISGYLNAIGTQKNDTLIGSAQANILKGEDGKDRLTGLDGDDQLTGGQGADLIRGDGGSDELLGGAGNDALRGGSGEDTFIFDIDTAFNAATIGVDRVLDFKRGQDMIVLDRSTFTQLDRRVRFASVRTLEAAQKSSALITYIRSSGRLYYNENGAEDGFGAGGRFATFARAGSADGALTAADFATRV